MIPVLFLLLILMSGYYDLVVGLMILGFIWFICFVMVSFVIRVPMVSAIIATLIMYILVRGVE